MTISHFTEVRTQIKDREALVQALEELGLHPEVHETAQHLYGYQGDRRPQKAEVIVRQQHLFSAANDVGFFKQPDGTYGVHLFDYQRSVQDELLKKITQRYGVIVAQKVLKARGYTVRDLGQQQDGSVRLVAQRW